MCDYFLKGHSVMQEQLPMCEKVLKSSHQLQELISSSLAAWNSVVPNPESLSPNFESHCWFTKPKAVTHDIEQKLTSWQDAREIRRQNFTETLTNQLITDVRSISAKDTTNTSTLFCLPSIFLIGFPKCGTSTFYNMITSHENVAAPFIKEGHFWKEFLSSNTDTKLYKEFQVLNYLYHFRPAAEAINRNPDALTIDASTTNIYMLPKPISNSYSDNACSVALVHSKVFPNAKYIIMMRNPVDRLWSHYWYACRLEKYFSLGSEIFHNLSVGAISEFNNCLKSRNSQSKCISVACKYDTCTDVSIGISLYYFHLERWLSVFPREQFLFLKTEEVFANTTSALKDVWQFLNQSEPAARNIDNIHKEKFGRYQGKFEMWPETREMLSLFFQPYNDRLAELLGDNKFRWNDS